MGNNISTCLERSFWQQCGQWLHERYRPVERLLQSLRVEIMAERIERNGWITEKVRGRTYETW